MDEEAQRVKSAFSVHAQMVFLNALKTLTNSKHYSERRIKFMFRLPLLSYRSIFFSVYSWLAFGKIFRFHRRLLEQLLESQAAIGKPVQTL